MTRLQKKCLIAAAGTHLLVVVVLLCSGFITSAPKQDDTQVLVILPSDVMFNVPNSGAKNAPTPPPTPVIKPPEPTPPIPDPPKPVVTPPAPVKVVEPVKPPEDVKLVKDPEISIPPPKPPKQHVIKVNKELVTVDNRQAQKEAAAAAEKAAREEKRLRDQKLKAIRDIARNVKDSSSAATTVDMPGASSVSYANYASYVKTIYERAWTPPDDTTSDDAVVKVSVTISRDGSVATSRIINPSGDKRVDASVQRTLDHIDFIREFPDGAKEKEKTFIINFNLKAKRMLG
jgi:TonB family protein